jgi:tetratricopeptide (TPR) repeat protein
VLTLDTGSETGRFFRRIDWSAFWTATLAAFAVYFFTLGPSVTLEDSGELAVAGDYLGVPHPPGYPIWTMIAWLFARVFSFVTFRGQPTPAWSIAMASAVFGALAAGCTAMLITRSASDMLRDTRTTLHNLHGPREDILCWAGGVAGSLAFAFSPVMWSQSTIVEVYALGAFFLMLVMLLTYRWMRRPTDRLLWMTAFVFGLGLTNYQVLLLAVLPLVVVIFLRNTALFRDFLIVGIPFGLTALALKLGAMNPQPGFGKYEPLRGEMNLPNHALCVAAAAVVALTLLLACLWPSIRARSGARLARRQEGLALMGGGFALGCLLLLAALLSARTATLANLLSAPLIAPGTYVVLAMLALAAIGLAIVGARFNNGRWDDPLKWGTLAVIGVILVVILGITGSIGTAPTPVPQPGQVPFAWAPYLGLVFLGLALMAAISLTTPNGIFFAAAVVVVQATLFGLLRQGALMGLTHPTTWWFWIPVALNFLFVGLAWITLPNGFTVAMTVLAAELGVSFYIYMPIVSDLRNPPMNWGYPRTWEGFKHALTRGQYEKIAPTNLFAPRFLKQLGGYFTDLRVQFTLLLAPLGFLPFAAWQLKRHEGNRGLHLTRLTAAVAALAAACLLWSADFWMPANAVSDAWAGRLRLVALALLVAGGGLAIAARVRPLHGAIALLAGTVAFVLLGNVGAIEAVFDAARIDKLLFGGILLLGTLGGLLLLLGQAETVIRRVLQSDNPSERLTVGLTLLGVLGFALAFLFKIVQAVLVYLQARQAKFPAATIAEQWGQIASAATPALSFAAVILTVILLAGMIFAHRHLRRREGADFSLDHVSQQWLIATVTAFLVMSVLLIVLANPKGDLQDTFIQKVKFISSHGLFAIWIGYGLVFGLATLDTLAVWFERRVQGGAPAKAAPLATLAMGSAILVTLALPLIPIHQNYTNERLVFEFGGAEQNGHDYGWQFGNYQLRGAEAISEELDADEEPLPNPSYPPEMGANAIFFGGTDPGRFVPTYMIYSARVREDVFLITQNALADNTYMSVMRDLYGDRIWIPTPEESASAFQVYVEEVQSGKRPKNADLVIENGRVQVSGALGVMEINGILCDMIFKYNKARHPFYIEESYVIPWMYPYLSPHGLIMKINNEQTPLAPRMLQDDLDFWDWYVRRLTRDERYRRDIVALKSFSKLRSAIAGLYSARGHLREAEQAYQEARMLYFVSPEANFRMVQDVLIRQQRYDEALDLIDLFIQADPNNDRGPGFRQFVTDIRDRQQRINALVGQIQPGQQPEIPVALELAGLYRDMGSPEAAARLLMPCLDNPRLTVREAYEIATLLDSAKSHAGAVRAIDIVMANIPDRAPAELYLNIARIYANAQESKKMIGPLTRYLALKPNDWQAWTDLATIHLIEQDTARAQTALRKAIEIGREQALQVIEGNPQLRQLAIPLLRQGALDAPGGRGLGLRLP